MAPRNVDRDTANAVLQDTLGISGDDIGMDREDSLADLNFGDDGEEIEGDIEGDDDTNLDADSLPGARNQEEPTPRQVAKPKPTEKPDDLSVSHTPKDEFDHGKPKFDKHGNILGSKGQIIATKGREARMYQSLHKTREDLNNFRTQANNAISSERAKVQQAVDIGMDLNRQLQALREVGQLHTKAGLNDEDLRNAIEFASAFKKNNIEGLKMILTRAATSGIDLTQLGLQPGGFDSKALLDMIRAEIGKVAQPITERQQQESAAQAQQREREEAVNQATQELNQFLTDEPDARAYLPVIQEVLKQPFAAKMSLGEVWTRIQLNLLRQQQNPDGGRQQQQQRSPNRPQQPRLPNGNGRPPNAPNGQEVEEELAPVNMSYEDILRGVLRATG